MVISLKDKSKHAALDAFRLAAAFLVVAIHVSPMQSVDTTADFILTRIIARVAVPFFLMLTGYFLVSRDMSGVGTYFNSFLKKASILYGLAILLYLPLNLYTGYFENSPLHILKDILWGGTFYHFWYLPAVLLGALVTVLLWRKFGFKFTVVSAAALYVIGLGGDSYYGLVAQIPFLKTFYDVIFSMSDYTRNGLFLAPIFLIMGAGLNVHKSASYPFDASSHPQFSGATNTRAMLITGLCISGALLIAEALLLRGAGVQRHDSMYIMLLPCMYFLFSLLASIDGRGRDGIKSSQQNFSASSRGKKLRIGAMVIYIIHPWSIVLIRGFAKLTGMTELLVDNQLVLYALVCIVSCAAAIAFIYLKALVAGPRQSASGRAWIEVDRHALRHNAEVLQKLLPASCRLMAVVKADGYGHGAVKVAAELEKSGVEAFAVATLAEGIALRKGGIRGDVLVFGYTRPEDARLLKRCRLSQTIVDGAYAKMLHETGVKIDVHIEIDTGMHRLGVDSHELSEIERIFDFDNLTVKGMFTHLSEADRLSDEATDFTLNQISLFIDTVNTLKAKGYNVGKLHIQESYGILNYSGLPCDYARAGIALYGVLCKNDQTRLSPDLHPALSLKARIAEVRWIKEGEAVSYSRTYVANAPMKIATVSIGYADGVPRNSIRRDAYVLLYGRKAPIVGLICMDLMIIDVTNIELAEPGNIVTVIGRDGEEMIRCEDVAESCGTITNELLSRLGVRLPRIFI